MLPAAYVAVEQVAPSGNAAAYTAGCQQCSRLPMLQQAPSMLRLPTCGDTALQVAPCEAPNSNAAAYTAGCQPWQYRTASCSVRGSQRRCCCLASGSLYAAPMLLAVKLAAVNCPPINCQPSLPAEKEPCLLPDPALYTAAAWPRLYCRLTGPVQPITARRPVLLPSPSDRCRCTHT
jgi:hypothetical protein